MIYAGILAAGFGWRQRNNEMPNQFLLLGGKPMLIHTLEAFAVNPEVRRIVVAAPANWVVYTRDLIAKYFSGKQEFYVVEGGSNKNQSIIQIISFIRERWGIGAEDICINHDAIRPFVTQRIINDNIDTAKRYNAVTTVMPVVDTMVVSDDGAVVGDMPDSTRIYAEQTPQSFRIRYFLDLYEDLEENKKKDIFDAVNIFREHGEQVHIVLGEYSNIKIVTQYDLEVANALLREKAHDS